MKLTLLLTYAFEVAVYMIRANKLRSFLSVLGMIFGVATLIVTLSIGEGTRRQILKTIEAMGSNLVIVTPKVQGGGGSSSGSFTMLGKAELSSLKNSLEEVEAIAPIINGAFTVTSGSTEKVFYVEGTTGYYALVRDLVQEKGRFITAADVDDSSRICVLGKKIADTFFKNADPAGKTVSIEGASFVVTGVLKEKGRALGIDFDRTLFIPISTMQEMIGRQGQIARIYLKAESSEKTGPLVQGVKNILRVLLKGRGGFEVWDQEALLKEKNRMTQIFKAALGSIAMISLLIGGIGIMNVLLISVTERVREVGLRKAIGASPLDIMFQFVCESVLLSVIGGLAGVLLGIFLGDIAAGMLIRFLPEGGQWQSVISVNSVLVSVLFSVGVGLVFGMYPAVKAAKLDPCEALTYQ